MRFLVCAVSCSLLAGCGSVSNTAESSITEQESVEENKETSGVAEAESSESDAAQEKNTDTSTEEKSADKNDGTANSNSENKSLAKRLAGKYSCITAHRGVGLIQGLVFSVPVGDVIAAAQKEGLILISASGNVIRFVPPLVIEKSHVDEMVGKLSAAIEACAG